MNLKRIFFFVIWALAFWAGRDACARIYEVGPGKPLERIGSVPFDRLEPGDLVKIYYREKPYQERILLRRSGTEQRPIRIKGIPYKGRLPIIEGKFAGAVQKENWKHRGRWLIKIGDDVPGDYIRIENLVLRNANNQNFTVDSKGKHPYTANAGGVFLTKGKHVVISNCRIYACGNGIISAYAPDVTHYFPYLGSALINNGISHVPLPVEYMPLPRGGGWKRSVVQAMDIGAYEFNPVILKKHFGSK